MLCGATLPMEHACERLGKIEEPFQGPYKMLVPKAKCLAGRGKQPHYCAQYAPTDPLHHWNERSIFICKMCKKYMEVTCHVI